MNRAASGSGSGRILICALFLAAGLLLLAGCTATAPQGGAAPTPAGLQSKMVYVGGNDRGAIVLIGMSTCPWCIKTKALLENMSVGYWWIDLNTLNETESAGVLSATQNLCGQGGSVPRLVIRGERCIVGYNETMIREAVA